MKRALTTVALCVALSASATVPQSYGPVSYSGNGATTTYSTGWPFFSSSEVVVTLSGVVQTLGTAYTVAGGGGLVGSVTFVSPPAGGVAIAISRSTGQTQPQSFRSQGQYFPQLHEKALDRNTMITQELGVKEAGDVSSLAASFSMGTPNASLAQVTATSNTAARTLAAWLADSINPRGLNAKCDGATDDGAALANAASTAASSGVGLLITCKIRIASAVGTISVPIRFEGGGSLDLRGGGTVTLTGELLAGVHQIFYSNGGTVAFGTITSTTSQTRELYPQWWGAKGDGATDDTAALNAAIAASIGRTLYIPAGKYIISSALSMTGTSGGYHLRGGSVLFNNGVGVAGGTWIANTGTGNALTINEGAAGNGQISIRDMAISGNVASANGIDITGASTIIMEDVWIFNNHQFGIRVHSNSFSNRFNRMSIGDNGNAGLYFDQTANGAVISNSTFYNNDQNISGYGDIIFKGTGGNNSLNALVIGCIFEGGVGQEFGIIAQGSNAIDIISNYIETISTSETLLYMDSTVSGFHISGNYFQDGLVTIAGSVNGSITDNYLLKTTLTTTLTYTPPAGGTDTVRITGNGTTGGATVSFVSRSGTAVLVAGTTTVANASVTGSSVIMISRNTPGGTVGDLRLGAVTAGASFVINSANALDTSTVNWWIVN